MKCRLSAHQRQVIEQVLKAAGMEDASFGWDRVTTTDNPCGPDGSLGEACDRVPVTEFIRARTEVFRESWIIAPLIGLLAADEEAAARGEP